MTRPLIGICTDHIAHFPKPGRDRSYLKLYPEYATSLVQAGATPLLLPIVPDVQSISPLLDLVQGVVTVGADDYPPQWYGKSPIPADVPVTRSRAEFDLEFSKLLYDRTDLPVFAVCGGMQMAVIHGGGSLIQDLPTGGAIEHRDDPDGLRQHEVEIEPDSLLAKACGVTRTEVNSMHHQAVEHPGHRVRVTARAPDGVIEAIEFTDHRWRIGVQWHPERMQDDEAMQRLWRAFVDACR